MERKLNSEQAKVVYSQDRRLLCLAGAGTGKTFTLIQRIKHLIEDLHVDPTSILALSFTVSAAHEMEERYKETIDTVSTPYFGTFHSFCYHILVTNDSARNAIGYTNIPKLIDEVEEKSYCDRARNFIKATSLPQAANSLRYEPKSTEKFQYSVFHKYLTRILVEDGKISFDRLCYSISKLFEDNHPSIQQYFEKYKYISVDEFQDTDILQWRMVNSFKDSDILLVGDIRQAIYQFRGGDSSIIKSLLQDDEWNVYKLQTNYRSTIQICDYANQWIDTYEDLIDDVKLVSNNNGAPIKLISLDEFINDVKHNDSNDIAILCRTNRAVRKIESQFEENSIKFSMKSNPEFLKLFKSALSNEYRKNFLLAKLPEVIRARVYAKEVVGEEIDYEQCFMKYLKHFVRDIEDIRNSEIFGELQTEYYRYNELLTEVPRRTGIYLGTIHSSKGLEYDTVYVYGVGKGYFNIYQDEVNMNAFYVAITRAKKQLIIVNEYPFVNR